MFNVGGGEILVIMVLALIVLGPDKLPDLARQIGRAMASINRMRERLEAETTGILNDTLRPGHITLPNGRGLSYPDDDGVDRVHGIAPNELTADDDRDWLALTPHHKTVHARVEALA